MPSHSSGAGYVPPDPILDDAKFNAALQAREAAQSSGEWMRWGLPVLTMLAAGLAGVTLSPAAVPVVLSGMSAMEALLLKREPEERDYLEFAEAARSVRDAIRNDESGE